MNKMKIKKIFRDNNDFLEDYAKSFLPDMYYKKSIRKRIKRTPNIIDYKMSNELKKETKNYWKENIGKNISLDWHKAYIATNNISDIRYVPENIYYRIIEPCLNRYDLAKAYKDKNNYDKLFESATLPKTIVRNINGNYYDKDYREINLDEALSELITVARKDKIVLKPSLDSGGGKDISIISFNNKNLKKRILSKLKSYHKDFIVQEFISQHDLFEEMHEDSLNTLRIITLRLKGKIYYLSGIVRVGNNGSYIDNATMGGLTCGFNKNGKLNYFATEHYAYEKHTIHPHSNFTFKGKEIPNIEKIKEYAKNLHKELFYFDIASWDIAIDKDENPILIEVNLNPQDINFHQRNNGPLFGDLTEEVLEAVIERSKN